MRKLMTAQWLIIVALVAFVVGGLGITLAQSTVLSPGEYDLEPGQYTFNVPDGGDPEPTPTDEPDPTATPVPPTPEPPGDGPTSFWHAPGVGDGDPVGHAHEHGDAPPAWADAYSMANFGYPVGFGGDESTPGEDANKHPGFKGYHTFFKGGEQYFRMHAMTTPLGQSGIFHSVEVYMLDPSGNVTFLQGWIDFAEGDSATENHFQSNCGIGMNPRNSNGRPQMEVNTFTCRDAGFPFQFEDWYSDFHSLLPEFGMNLKSTYFNDGDPNNPATWTESPDGNTGLTRRIEVHWIHPAPGQGGTFYATQFGDIVGGPDDPVCGSETVQHGQTHTTLCLFQEIAPTALTIQFPGNAIQKVFPGSGIVQLPN